MSDLPLHVRGISHLPDAIAFVLRDHDFRAGQFRLGYQSCDDSTAKQGEFELENAVYTAEATEVLLAAIARSDGSRASVAAALRATRIEDGLIGDVSFDADGDVRPRPYAIVRLSRRADTFNGVERGGGNLVAVISP